MTRPTLLLAALVVAALAAPGVACGEAPPDAEPSPAADAAPDTEPSPAADAAAHTDDPADTAAAAPAAGANLLLVTIDTLRADRLGVYGWADARTPVLDALAARGVRAERALAATPVTLPSHTTLLTGLHPLNHGVRDNGVFRADDALLTLAERLAAAGRDTAAFVSAHVLSAQFGLAQGFAHYGDRFGPSETGSLQRPAHRTVDRLLEWLARREPDADAPWFAWLHLFDPHAPYAPPPGFHPGPDTDASTRYDAEIAFVDHQLGRLFAELERRGELARTLVLVTADHGEGLGDHHEVTHGLFIYDATQRVPLLLAGPGVAGGRVLDGQIAAVDVVPTLLELLGLPAHGVLDGRSFAARVTPGARAAPPDEHVAYLEAHSAWHTLGAAPIAGVSTAEHKYVDAPRPEFYDLRLDPGETTNRFDPARPEVRELAGELTRLRETAAPPAASGPSPLDARERERLAALGYVIVAPERRPPPDGELPDPKDVAERSNELRLELAVRLARADWPRARELSEELLALTPGDITAAGALGQALLALGRFERAEEVLRELLSRRADLPDPAIHLAHVMRLTGRPEEALGAYDLALAAAPRHPKALLEAAQIAFELGDDRLAIQYGERALESGALTEHERARTAATLEVLRERVR